MPQKAKPTGNKRIREGQKLARKRAKRQWWHTCRRRALISAGAILTSYIIVAVAWFAYTGGFVRASKAVSNYVFTETAKIGFRTTYIYVDGRKETPMEDVTRAISVKAGEPILAVSVDDMRARLTQLPQVRTVRVERVLPDQLYIHIEERVPVAVWQYQGKLQLVDSEGKVMPEAHIEKYGALPLIVGEGAPEHAAEMLAFLAAEPELASQVRAAVMIGGRRWNIRFDGGLELKLPDSEPGAAWHHFAELNHEQNLLGRDIVSVDMRLLDRIFVKSSTPKLPPAPPGQSRET